MENTWKMHDNRLLLVEIFLSWIMHFIMCTFLISEPPLSVPTARTNSTYAFLLSNRPTILTGGILEITKPCPSVPVNSSLYFSKTIFNVRKSDTTTGRKVTYIAPNLFRSFGLQPKKDKLKDSVTAYHKSKQSGGAIRFRKIRFVLGLLTLQTPVDSFGFVSGFFR